MASSVSVYIQGSDTLGKVFGDTARVKTAVYTLPTSVSALSTAVQRSSGSVLVLTDGHTSNASSPQIASALEKLSNKKEPVVAYVGGNGVFLNASAVSVLKSSFVTETVAVPTRSGDDVPGAETFSPSPVVTYEPAVGARALANVDVKSSLDRLVATGVIKTENAGTLFVMQTVPAPAQVADYSAWTVSSPVSDGFQGSPSTATDVVGEITYYNPTSEVIQNVSAQAAQVVSGGLSGQTQAQSVASSWWLWLIIVIILVILLIVSVVLYYRR
jgi:hypothetical protein